MGFWSSFFGHAAANAYRDIKKEERETQKWNDLFHEKLEWESEFNDYLKSVGVKDLYIADVEYVNNGNILPIKREIDNLRKKVDEYLSLGGDAIFVYELEKIDQYIEKVKYLKSIGRLDQQLHFRDDDKYSAQNKVKEEEKELQRQQDFLKKQQQEQHEKEVTQIIGTDINLLSGIDFEMVCQQLVENMGFETETTKASGDGGIDLIAYNHQPLLSGKYIIQCKRYSGSVGEPIIRDLYGVVMSERANKGILMTTGVFTKSAVAFAEGKPIELIDGNQFNILLKQYNLITDFEQDAEEMFDLENYLGYDFDKYSSLIREIEHDGGNIKCRCMLIEVLYEAIMRKLRSAQEISISDTYKAIDILYGYLQPFIDKDNSRNSNKKLKCIYYMSLLVDGELSVYKGDFVYAVKQYTRVLSLWNYIDDCDWFEEGKMEIIYTLFAIFRIFNLPEQIDKYYSRYKELIQRDIEVCKNCNNIYAQIYEDKYNAKEYVTFDLSDLDEDVSVLYDNLIDQFGNAHIPTYVINHIIDIDRRNDNLVLHSVNIHSKNEKDIVLIKGISKIIKEQREEIKRF